MIASIAACIFLAMYICYVHEKRINKRRAENRNHRIASDKYGYGIWSDSDVMFRGKKCNVKWDKDMLTFYLVPEDDNVVRSLPFTTHIAKECEVLR